MSSPSSPLPQWAPRVKPERIRRLYAGEAAGLLDEELLNEVFYAIRARCESIITVTEASAGRVKCPSCSALVLRHIGSGDAREEMLCTVCGWRLTWGEYLKTYQGKQLHGGGAVPAIQAYLDGAGEARSPQQKMLLIDALLHAYHWEAAGNPTRPLAVNMIQGTIHNVVAFLEELGFSNDPQMREHYRHWQENVRRVEQRWGPYRRS